MENSSSTPLKMAWHGIGFMIFMAAATDPWTAPFWVTFEGPAGNVHLAKLQKLDETGKVMSLTLKIEGKGRGCFALLCTESLHATQDLTALRRHGIQDDIMSWHHMASRLKPYSSSSSSSFRSPLIVPRS